MKEILDLLSGLKDARKSAFMRIYADINEELKTKPSSTKYHHSEAGGMGRHIKEVMNIALEMYDLHPSWYEVPRDSVAIVAFIHDFSKLGRYKELALTDWRRQVKYGAQEFEYDATKTYINETAEVVHLCARAGIILTYEEVNAVTFHHGFISESAKDNFHAMDHMTPLSVLLHFADMMSVKVWDSKDTLV